MFKARQSPSGPVGNALLRGSALTLNPDLTLSPISRPRHCYDWDWFLSGGLTQSTIGRMGWTLSGTGTPSVVRVNSSYNNTSKVQVSTSATSGDRTTVTLGNTESRQMCSPLEFDNVVSLARIAIPATAQRSFIGWSDDFSVDPLAANNALGFNFDTSVSPYLQVISRIGGVDVSPPYTALDIGVVRSNVGQYFVIIQDEDSPGQFDFYANSINLGAPTTPIFIARLHSPGFDGNHGYRVETLANAVCRIDLAYWGMNSDDLSGVMASDDLL